MAVDVTLSGTELRIAFDDTSDDSLTLSINATGFQTTGSNITSGVGTVARLVVTDIGRANTSHFTLQEATQVLSGGVSIGVSSESNVRIADVTITAPVTTGDGDIQIYSDAGTLSANLSSNNRVGFFAVSSLGGLSLQADVTVQAGASTSLENVNGPGSLTVSGPGTFDVSGGLGLSTPLASLHVDNDVTTRLFAPITTAGPQTFGGPVQGNSFSNITLTGSSGTFDSTFTAFAFKGSPQTDLVLTYAAPTIIDNSFVGLRNLTSHGPVELNGTITTLGGQNYAAAATLSADATLIAAGGIDFGGHVDGARMLNLQSTGNITFSGPLGSETPLQGLNLASAAAVTALSSLTINGTGGSSAGLTIASDVNNVNIAQPGSSITSANLSGLLLAGGSTGSTLGGFTITDSGRHGIEAAGGSYVDTTVGNSSVTTSAGDGFHATNASGLTGTFLHSAGNSKAGVRVAGSSSGVTISSSIVGLTGAGNVAQPNLGQGVIVSSATGTSIENTTISGNRLYGVVLNEGANTSVVSNNRIGTGTDGTTPIGNGQSGIFVLDGATETSIIGNTIRSNNGMAGIQVVAGVGSTVIGGTGSSANLLVGNGLFGMTVSGTTAARVLGNLITGHTTDNLYLNNAKMLAVGSSNAGEGNSFSGTDYGLYAGGDLTGTTIENNSFSQHTLAGVVLNGASNLTFVNNTLDDNGVAGLYATGDLTSTAIRGNTISNHTVGVAVENGSNLSIGSDVGTTINDPAANLITKNTNEGIVVSGAGSQHVSILSNAIYENGLIGIRLSDDGNARAVAPSLTTATTAQVTGSISGTNGDVYRIQYFKSSDAVTASSRSAQGQDLIASQDVVIDGSTVSIDLDIGESGVMVNDWITATATLIDVGLPAETSEFCFGIRVTA